MVKSYYLLGNIWIATGSFIFRRDVVEKNKIVFDTINNAGEDQEFYMKVLFHSKRVSSIPEVKRYYVIHENSLTNSKQVFNAIYPFLNFKNYIKKFEDNEVK